MSTSPLGNYLVSLTKAERTLHSGSDTARDQKITDLAVAAKEYAKAASLGESAAISAEKIRLQAQREAGGLLNQLEKGKAGRPKNTSQPANNFSPYRETLEEAEIGRDRAARWQQVAAIPEEKFSAYIQTNEEKGKELTTAGALLPVTRAV